MSLSLSHRGFTLIELLAVLVIVAILTAVALPAYNSSIRKSRRSDAVTALTSLQQAQERWRANHIAYTSTLSDLCPADCSVSPGGYYNVSVAGNSTGYVVTAAAVSGSSQAEDAQCTTMRLQLQLGNVFYGGCNGCAAPAANAQVSDPNRCWAR